MNQVRSQRHVVVIGAGIAGLSAACHLARAGFHVDVLEKHNQPGGRARIWESEGFRFDMGPSWYWMPDLFDRFFQTFGYQVSDLYTLERLDPSYRVYFDDGTQADIPADLAERRALLEQWEPGASQAFDEFIRQTQYIYETATGDYLLRPSLSFTEFFDFRIVRELYKLRMMRSMRGYAKKFFRHPNLVQLMEWPVLFLGAPSDQTSAMYSLMTYADAALGTWFPQGGMHRIIEAMVKVAESLGVNFHFGQEVESIQVEQGQVNSVVTSQRVWPTQAVVAAADYHHVEQNLLSSQHRQYSRSYWDKRVMSPSSLLFYLGVQGELPLQHHNLFFDQGMKQHMDAVYKKPVWPDKPLFYACVASKTDPSCAPPGHENLFLLIPLAAGLHDSNDLREQCYNTVMARLEHHTGQPLRDRVVLKRSYAMTDFVNDYHAYKGNAYGMANTLRQTGPLKPKLRSDKVQGLYFAGQLTVPGPGMPPSLISGELASRVLSADLLQQR
ncbi:MAG: phytoene desaturase [Deltaproteobacteria bacterium]|nr:MAG: phytoene desaturase [Deltaproteobacteria bacterium]